MTEPTSDPAEDAAAPADGAVPVDDDAADVTADEEPEKKHQGSFFRELPFLLGIAFVLALVIKAFLVQAFYIPSGSMENTLRIRDRVLVNKVVYRFRDIHRGEIVVFNGLDSFQSEVSVPKPRNGFDSFRRKFSNLIGLGQPGEKDFIKRVIGLPGDTVACCTNGHVTVNNHELDEPYLFQDDHQQFGPVLVPKGRLFVMGDHRGASSDSRRNGTVPESKVIGRAFVVVWPPSHAKGLPVPRQIERAGIPPASALSPPVLGLLGALPITAIRRRRRRRAAR